MIDRNVLFNHLMYNHFPPLGVEWVEPCAQAIQSFNDGQVDTPVKTPYGESTANTIIELFHLDFWVNP